MEGTVITRCLKEFGAPATKICCLQEGHDEPCYGYPAKSTHGSLLRALRDAREQHQGAVAAERARIVARIRREAGETFDPQLDLEFRALADLIEREGGQ
jgi:hypothetical protein